MDQLTSGDMEFIGDAIFPNIDKEIISKMVEFSHTVGPRPGSAGNMQCCQPTHLMRLHLIIFIVFVPNSVCLINLSFAPLPAGTGSERGEEVGSERGPLGVQPARHVPLVSADAGRPIARLLQPGAARGSGLRRPHAFRGRQGTGNGGGLTD